MKKKEFLCLSINKSQFISTVKYSFDRLQLATLLDHNKQTPVEFSSDKSCLRNPLNISILYATNVPN